jgi:DNA-directed RNA polymerase subunit RPC12/RpoP
MIICRRCNKEFPDKTKFCTKCGAKVEQATEATHASAVTIAKGVVCPKCGSEYPLNTKFCKKDGVPLVAASAPPVPADKNVTADAAESEPKVEVLTKTEVTLPPDKHLSPCSEVTPPEKPTTAAPGITCPKCGASYDANTKFCKKDGTPLVSGKQYVCEKRNDTIIPDNASQPASKYAATQILRQPVAIANKNPVKSSVRKPSRKTIAWVAVCLAAGIISVAGGYFFIAHKGFGTPQPPKSESTATPAAPATATAVPETVTPAPAPTPSVTPAESPDRSTVKKPKKKPAREKATVHRSAPVTTPEPTPVAASKPTIASANSTVKKAKKKAVRENRTNSVSAPVEAPIPASTIDTMTRGSR